MATHEVRSVQDAFVEDRWDEIPQRVRPAESGLRHVVATDRDGTLLGAAFCVPTERPDNETSCELGWFFTAGSLPGSERAEVADSLVTMVDEELARSGYEAVATDIGSEADEQVLSRHHRYLPAPLGERKHRWIKSLRADEDSPVSASAARKEWKSVGAQHALYATTDIGKGDVIIDLKRVMKRVEQPSAYTLQLAEGVHCRAFERGLGINHHCSPNGYYRFDDLTFRALRDVSEGDELTFHYCTTEYELSSSFDCLCGSPDCLGRVRGFKYLSKADVERLFDLLSPFLRSKL